MSNHERIKQALRLNQKINELQSFYEEWSLDYDQDVSSENYSGPELIAAMACALYTDEHGDSSVRTRASSHVLDAGCGTGLAGKALAEKGFNNITGVDLSPKMVKQAHKLDCYKALHANVDLTQPINPQVSDSKPESQELNLFDLTVCVGVFTLGHVPPTVMGNLVEHTRSGGYVLATVREEYCKKHDFETYCQQLVQSGLAHLELSRWDHYVSNDKALYVALRVA